MKVDSGPHEWLIASAATRLIYVAALARLVLGPALTSSGWIGLTLGGGYLAGSDRTMMVLLAGAALYRIYTVLRYREALNARPPSRMGWLLRMLGWLLMAAGAVGAVSLFLVKPITMLIFKTPGDAGIAFFVTGLFSTLLASVGPIGCAVFEVSRRVGRQLPASAPPRRASARKQDYAVMACLGLLALAVVATPALVRLTRGPVSGSYVTGRCVAPTLLDCAGRIEGSVVRVAAVPVGGAVRLQSNIEAIQYRHPALQQGEVVLESMQDALERAGYRVAPDADVGVEVEATTSGTTPVLAVHITDKMGDVARFTTLFTRDARVESTPSGARRIVVSFGRDVEWRPAIFGRSADGSERLVGGLYAQLRKAIGSEREAAVSAAELMRTATPGPSAVPPAGYHYSERSFAPDCVNTAEFRRQTAPEQGMPPFISAMHEVSFAANGQTALLRYPEFVSCHDGAVWFIRQEPFTKLLHVRRYDTQGNLQSAWRVTLPEAAPGAMRYPEAETIQEVAGQVQLRMYVIERPGKQQLTSFFFPM